MYFKDDKLVRAVVLSRCEVSRSMFVKFAGETRDEKCEVVFVLVWWKMYRCYLAKPVVIDNHGNYILVNIKVPAYWLRAIKHTLRRKYGVRHIGSINNRDNFNRVSDLMCTKFI